MTPRVERAINVLLDALNNKTLVAGHPCGCAVGNLVANGMGLHLKWRDDFEFVTKEGIDNSLWFNYNYSKNEGRICDNEFSRSTEFTLSELAQIEKAFEDNSRISHMHIELDEEITSEAIRADQIKALEAVVKVMLSFDESKDDVKEVFTNKADLIPV